MQNSAQAYWIFVLVFCAGCDLSNSLNVLTATVEYRSFTAKGLDQNLDINISLNLSLALFNVKFDADVYLSQINGSFGVNQGVTTSENCTDNSSACSPNVSGQEDGTNPLLLTGILGN